MDFLIRDFLASSLNLANIVGADTRWSIAWMLIITGFGFFGLKTRDVRNWTEKQSSHWQTAFRAWLAFGGFATLALLFFEPIQLVIWLPVFGAMFVKLLRKRDEIGLHPEPDSAIEATPPSS